MKTVIFQEKIYNYATQYAEWLMFSEQIQRLITDNNGVFVLCSTMTIQNIAGNFKGNMEDWHNSTPVFYRLCCVKVLFIMFWVYCMMSVTEKFPHSTVLIYTPFIISFKSLHFTPVWCFVNTISIANLRLWTDDEIEDAVSWSVT